MEWISREIEKIKCRVMLRKKGVKVPIFRPLKPSEWSAIQGIIVCGFINKYLDEVAPLIFEAAETERE